MPPLRKRLKRTIATAPKPEGVYIGIDPGSSGGLVSVVGWDVIPVDAQPMPKSLSDIWSWVSRQSMCVPGDKWVFAAVEKVGGYTKARGPQPGSTMFNFGRGYGALLMALTAAGIPYEEVPPQEWQGYYGFKRDKGESDTAWKNRLKARAQELFPDVKVTLAVSDALLIAAYCRACREGKL